MTDIIDKIRKLRALANSSNVHEAAAAAARAEALIQEHRLDEAAFEEQSPARETAAVADDPLWIFGGKRSNWKMVLIRALCRQYDVAHWIDSPTSSIKVCGRPSDVLLVREMFAWVDNEIDHLAKKISGMGRGAIQSFRLGAAFGVADQLGEAKAATVKAAATSTAMVLASRADEALAIRDAAVPGLRKIRGTRPSVSDGGAFNSGRVHGQRMQLGGTKRLGGL